MLRQLGLQFAKIAFLGSALAAILASAWMLADIPRARAGNYQFLFNNVEQSGTGSTANPMIQVDGAKVTKTPGAPGVLAETPPASASAEAASPVAEAAPASQSVVAVEPPPERETGIDRHWRLEVENFHARDAAVRYGGTLDQLARPRDGSLAAFATYRLHPSLLARFGGGLNRHDAASAPAAFGLAEVEAIPLRLALFGWPNFLELGVSGGVNTPLGLGQGADVARYLHGGARLGVNFGRDFGLNLTTRVASEYTSVGLGLSVRL